MDTKLSLTQSDYIVTDQHMGKNNRSARYLSVKEVYYIHTTNLSRV